MSGTRYIAHKAEDGRLQSVRDHLAGTANLAAGFAEVFDCSLEGRLCGQLHDIGKYSAAFQRRILQGGIRVDHSTAGARALFRRGQMECAFAVAGHHGGLPDCGTRADTAEDATLLGRMKRKVDPCEAWLDDCPVQIPLRERAVCADSFEEFFYIHMLYSCLVDADYIDTETFMNGSPLPRGENIPLDELLRILRGKANQYLATEPDSDVNRLRNAVLRQCLEQGKIASPGLFTLTVPTGGGKTFASMAFALEHATAQHKRRIIYVIPYTSIIDQTVSVFSELFGEDALLAHYSDVDYKQRSEEELTPQDYRRLLASENWDAPIVITTAVQFFESLFSHRSSRCRKLHNIASSVIIFDEAQTLPINYLKPCMAAISELAVHYGVSAVLCTATQPAVEPLIPPFARHLPLRELAPDPAMLAEKLRRVTIRQSEPISSTELAERMALSPAALCIVNLRASAQEIYRSLPEDNRFCLTTLLCPEDRRRQLERIRALLKEGKPCRVVSTSLIEAGVDVDFPVVYREHAGLDAVLQAAGRCNREGKRAAKESIATVFSLRDTPLPRYIEQNVAAFDYAARKYPSQLNALPAISAYFTSLYYNIKGENALDAKGIEQLLQRLAFTQVGERFHLIETPARPVYIPIGEGAQLCEDLLRGRISRSLFRRLGKFSVNVFPDGLAALEESGAIQATRYGDIVLTDLGRYSRETGLDLDSTAKEGLFL